jgi:uncharacterized Zn finger protein (UPF0148 family)
MTSRFPDLACPKCGSNRFKFPKTSSGSVRCDECGHEVASLDALQSQIVAKANGSESRAHRARRHASEIAESHDKLRASVAETDRLIVASNAMLKRHRQESDDAGD